MGLLMIVFLSSCYISFSPQTASAAIFDVTAYGAKGDWNTDDTKAFIQAWADLCRDKSSNPTLVIPPRNSFLIGPVTFSGPCNFPAVHVQQVATKKCERPMALHFNRCNGLRLNGTTHADSPSLHISIVNCQNIDLGHLRILAPADSPNTDGIDLSASSQINIHDSSIHIGDDCVAINGGIYDINVTRVFCGPGHGISLGENGGYDTVEKVHVRNCNITGTTNGLRIKTVPGGTGYARGIVFQDIHLVNVENPIIIDQHYWTNAENSFCQAPPTDPAVQVSDVVYMNIHGSSASKQAITLNCSGKFNCTGIHTYQVGITGADDFLYCKNAQGKFLYTNPTVRCS
ncbi:hypothetical protein L1987_10007 [Smallanthus sonchifolius]|uniref:Uncharacterized protein n=1 Tax=Smallanthus sonchifolius TaxID=185202 RepID=A0ACB9JQX5_9ASTR|nr:hypothetical protein L1987_10007 [Smallanthus sonchifolius]